jgi:hypothetical protein
VRGTSKASSAGSTSRHGRSRGLFGLACLCVLGLVALLGSSAPSADAVAAFPGQGFLPQNRAWEMVSPPEKNGEVGFFPSRIRAAADGSAIGYLSLQGSGDAVGSGLAFEYMAQRSGDPAPGTNGWGSHAITPPQPTLTLLSAAAAVDPGYRGEFSDDLTKGVFFSFGSLVNSSPSGQSDVANGTNLYLRDDLRAPGAGSYQLLTHCPRCAAEGTPLSSFEAFFIPTLVGASQDFSHVTFESKLRLTADATQGPLKLYESHDGTTHLAGVLPNGTAAFQSVGGLGVYQSGTPQNSSHVITADGSRIFFTSSTTEFSPEGGPKSGEIYARVNGRSTVQLNASERAVPEAPQNAVYWDASTDGSRVFFTSPELLTEDATGAGGAENLYMWKQAEHNETQRVAVDATGGSFDLLFNDVATGATGTGELSEGSSEVTGLTTATGAFSVGQQISGAGIPADTEIVKLVEPGVIQISAPATESGSGVSLTAGESLPFDASAAEVQAALEHLISVKPGNVSVSGGPGSAGATTPYEVTFEGDFAGANVAEMSADGSGLTGGAASATVTTTEPVHNLTFLNVDEQSEADFNIVEGVYGASADGRYVYFAAQGQLVDGAPEIQYGVYLWHDGTLTYVGENAQFGFDAGLSFDGNGVAFGLKQPRVTPDGRHLLFNASSGHGLLSLRGGVDYDHGHCGGSSGCREFYLYSADTDTLECVSCNPSGVTATASAEVGINQLGGATTVSANSNPRSLSADGRYAFFTTAEALVADDTNGVSDAYVYDATTGEPRLLSSGTSVYPSFFLEASADGRDAFFITRERLSGWDVDDSNDIYDARIDGGFPEPPPPPPSCQGDACQPAPRVLNDPTPSSASVQGPGNERDRVGRCAKGQRKVRSRGKTRCVKAKKQSKQHKRDPNSNRRAGR